MSATTIRPCGAADLAALFSIVNDAAQAYKGVIPADCYPHGKWRRVGRNTAA